MTADTPDPRPFSEEGWPEGSRRDEWNDWPDPRPVCAECEEWRKSYNAAVANGHGIAARSYDRRIAAHERAHRPVSPPSELTAEEARKRLLLAWFQAHPNQPMPEGVKQFDRLLDSLCPAAPQADANLEGYWKRAYWEIVPKLQAALDAAPRADAGTLREALKETAEAFHAVGWHDRIVFGHRAYSFEECVMERCTQNRTALAASRADAAGRDLDEGNWQPGYSEEFKRGFMTAIQEGLDPQTLAMAMDIAAEIPIFDTGLTRADVVVREYKRLAETP